MMKLYYQGVPGAYSNIAANNYSTILGISEKDIIGLISFKDVFIEIEKGNLGIIPIENSYAGSVHENFFHLSNFNVKILSEYYLLIKHCLLSKSNDINTIKIVYSHYQAIMQCENYINKKLWKAENIGDTAGSAKYISEHGDNTMASICSNLCADIYGLNILDSNIQDQNGNTTRFFLVGLKNQDFSNFYFTSSKKMSIIFKVKNIPSALYKCLGAFSTRAINLTRIESLPAKDNPFEYMFWLDFETTISKNLIDQAMEELHFFSKDIKILGEY